jgi:hypothetical protein
MTICHFCQISIKDHEKVCKQCLHTNGTPQEDGGISIPIDGKKIMVYSTFFVLPPLPTRTSCFSLGPDFDSNVCILCDSRCGQLMCDKCIKENMTESVTKGVRTTSTTINKQTVQNFEDEIICDEFNG